MIGSLYSGISGLKANTSAMAVIGDNIANVDTTGFKTSRVSFANIFSASLGQSDIQIGRGVTMNAVSPSWDVGSLENTTVATDLAINGQGLFVVRDPSDNGQYYSRAGKFEFDRNRNLVNQDGLVAQGYPISITGAIGGLADLTLPAATNAPNATTTMSMNLNLDAGAADGDTYTTSMTTYNSVGSQVDLEFAFTYDLANTEWDWAVTPSIGASATTGSVSFNNSGVLTSPVAEPTLSVTGMTGADDLAITWDMLTGAASNGTITGYDAESAKTSQTQDGYASGALQGVSIDEDGIFTGVYSNGTLLPFARIALADFANLNGLAKQGSNLFNSSLESGQAVIGTPGTAGMGSIASSTLEMSNVDLATEFVEMITTQRAFQANSKVITTSDEILAELINIKR